MKSSSELIKVIPEELLIIESSSKSFSSIYSLAAYCIFQIYFIYNYNYFNF